jgi:N-carbamoyl-L-amino-acid hydrolase
LDGDRREPKDAYLRGAGPGWAGVHALARKNPEHEHGGAHANRSLPGTLRINPLRFEHVLRELSLIGADPGGGLSRLGLSADEGKARTYLSERSRQVGLVSRTDPAGNLLVGRANPEPGLPVLLLGSHLDTVRRGGWLDGAYGVVAALEVLTILVENAVECRYEPMVVGFANEEGALVQYPFWGSHALTGTSAGALDASDREGNRARAYLLAAGGDPDRLAQAAWPHGSLAAFLELHIEQGPTLERRSIPIGVVDCITGRTIFEFTLIGEPGHAGTTPMAMRQDALSAAARLVLKVESIASELGACSTATVGFLQVIPNVTNTIPGSVRLTAEIRDTDASCMRTAGGLLESMAAYVAQETGVKIAMQVAHGSQPVATDPRLRAAVERAAGTLSLEHLTMSSGAGHDAQIMAAVCPVGMIFVPSERGESHTPNENTDVPALVTGADVLLNTVIAIEGAPG